MKSFIIYSINTKNCKNTLEKVLKALKKCVICGQIPLPIHRNDQNKTNAYCRTCLDKQNFDSIIHVETNEYYLEYLEELKINCKFIEKGCSADFTVDTLNEFLIHEKKW